MQHYWFIGMWSRRLFRIYWFRLQLVCRRSKTWLHHRPVFVWTCSGVPVHQPPNLYPNQGSSSTGLIRENNLDKLVKVGLQILNSPVHAIFWQIFIDGGLHQPFFNLSHRIQNSASITFGNIWQSSWFKDPLAGLVGVLGNQQLQLSQIPLCNTRKKKTFGRFFLSDLPSFTNFKTVRWSRPRISEISLVSFPFPRS